MDETVIVVMLKDEATGFLDKELASCKVPEHEDLIVNIFAVQNGADKPDGYTAHMKITTDRDVEDWEFSAVYDYYDEAALAPETDSVEEVEECYNPTWEVTFPFVNDDDALGEKISAILRLHTAELASVYEAVAEHKNDYME